MGSCTNQTLAVKLTKVIINQFSKHLPVTQKPDIGRESQFLPLQLHSTPPLRGSPSEYYNKVWYEKLKRCAYPIGKKFEDMSIHFDRIHKRDRWTEGHHMAAYAVTPCLCKASCAKNCCVTLIPSLQAAGRTCCDECSVTWPLLERTRSTRSCCLSSATLTSIEHSYTSFTSHSCMLAWQQIKKFNCLSEHQ